MNYNALLKTVTVFLSRNSTTILTATAVAGVLSTTVLAVRATTTAVGVIIDEETLNPVYDDDDEPVRLSKKDVARLTWKLYLPAAVMGTLTISCIIGSNSISTRKNAMLMSAYTLTEKAYHDYKDQIVEMIGEKKEGEARDAIAKKRLDDQPVKTSEVIITGLGETLFHDSISGRYFKSDVERVRKAENDINFDLIHGDDKSLNDFYANLGLEITGFGDTVGWNYTKLLETHFSSHISKGGQPCISIEYSQMPFPAYYKIHTGA